MKTTQLKLRNYKYDNLKALLIFLVVFGHFLTPISKTDFIAKIIYMTIYIFHMPAFIYITGKFAKPDIKKILKFLLLYIIFQIIYIPFLQYFDDPTITWSFITPQWILWYLVSLIVYYCLLYVIPTTVADKQKKLCITAAFVLAILVGFIPFIEQPFSLSRTLVFLPFFLMGKWDNNQSDKPAIKGKTILCGFLAGLLTCVYMIGSFGNRELLYQRCAYINAGSTWYFRLLVLMAAVLFIKILLNVMSNKRIPIITFIGQNTLAIFLCHGFIVKLYHYYVPSFTVLEALLMSIITTIFITGITYLFKRIIQPKRSNHHDMQNHPH